MREDYIIPPVLTLPTKERIEEQKKNEQKKSWLYRKIDTLKKAKKEFVL